MIKRAKPSIPLESVLIVSEDTKSSVDYFNAKIAELGLHNCKTITIKVVGSRTGKNKGTSPDKVAAKAIGLCETFNQNAQKQGKLPYTKVYCVIDVDDWDTKIPEAIDKLSQKCTNKLTYRPIISNECFEVWYILHFKELGDTKPIRRPRKGAIAMTISDDERTDKLLESYLSLKMYGKGGDIFPLLQEKGDEEKAIRNAKWLVQYHSNNPTEGNPASDAYIIIEHLNQMAVTFQRQGLPIDTSLISLKDISVSSKFTDASILQLVQLINEEYSNEKKEDKLKLCVEILQNPVEVSAYTDKEKIVAFIYQAPETFE